MSYGRIQSSLLLNLRDASESIEYKLEEYLADYPIGYYLVGHSKPTLLDKLYYTYSRDSGGTKRHAFLVGIEKIVKEPLYDEFANIAFDPGDKEVILDKHFLKVPSESFRGFEIVSGVLDNLVFKLLEYGHYSHRTFTDVITPLLKVGLKENKEFLEELWDKVSPELTELTTTVIDFMNRDYKLEYDITYPRLMFMRITKGEDFRIAEYERIKKLYPNLVS